MHNNIAYNKINYKLKKFFSYDYIYETNKKIYKKSSNLINSILNAKHN